MSEANISMQQVAERAGVSRMTVSRALRNDPDISEKTKVRVRRICDEMGYRPDARISELMSHLRRARGSRLMETVALICSKPEIDTGAPMFSEKRQRNGCYERAEELGLKIDYIEWRHSELTVKALIRMLHARGIRAAILQVVGTPPEGIEKLYHEFSVVSLGGGLPELNHSHSDHWQAMSLAVRRIVEYGYSHVGLYLLPRLLDWTLDLWVSAFKYEMERQGLAKTHTVLVQGTQCGSFDEVGFMKWISRVKPEVVLSHIPARDMVHILRENEYKVPQDIAVATVEWMPEYPEIAGVDQVSENLGRSAVDMTARQLSYSETGTPPYVKKLLVPGKWQDGASLPSKH